VRKKKELSDFKTLLKNSDCWQKADRLRDYIFHLEKMVHNDSELSEKLCAYIAWAKEKTDLHDPSVSKEDALLKNVHTN
jgi:hypothetical protein